MRKFIDEHAYSSGRYGALTNFPDPSSFQVRTVVIPLEQLVQFRNDMLLLTKFAALVCKTSEEELCSLDLMAPFLKIYPDEEL